MEEPATYVPLALGEVTLVTTVPAEVVVRNAVLLGAPAVGVCVVVRPEVVFGRVPTIVVVTLKFTVQLLLAGMVIPVKLRAVWPGDKTDGVVPAQVPPTIPPKALIFTSVSVNAPPVSANELLLDSVKVARELAPCGIEVGLNVLAIVGDVLADVLTMVTSAAGSLGEPPPGTLTS